MHQVAAASKRLPAPWRGWGPGRRERQTPHAQAGAWGCVCLLGEVGALGTFLLGLASPLSRGVGWGDGGTRRLPTSGRVLNPKVVCQDSRNSQPLSLSCRSLPPASPPWAWALGGRALGGEKTTDGAVRGRGCGRQRQVRGRGCGHQMAGPLCIARILGRAEQKPQLVSSHTPPIRSAVTCSGRCVPS